MGCGSVVRDETRGVHSGLSNKALEYLAKEFTFYPKRVLGELSRLDLWSKKINLVPLSRRQGVGKGKGSR